ncbi:hypothetical protein FQZ97_975410 [compost metagenome]
MINVLQVSITPVVVLTVPTLSTDGSFTKTWLQLTTLAKLTYSLTGVISVVSGTTELGYRGMKCGTAGTFWTLEPLQQLPVLRWVWVLLLQQLSRHPP